MKIRLLFLCVALAGSLILSGCGSNSVGIPITSTNKHSFDATPDLAVFEIFQNGASLFANFNVPVTGFINFYPDLSRIGFTGFVVRHNSNSVWYPAQMVSQSSVNNNSSMLLRIGNLESGASYQIQTVIIIDKTDTSFSPMQTIIGTSEPVHWVREADFPLHPDWVQFGENYSFVIGSSLYMSELEPYSGGGVYDAQKNIWTSGFGMTINHNFTAVVGTSAYVRGGNFFQIYDQIQNSSYDYTDTVNATSPFVFSIGNYIYVGAGVAYSDTNNLHNNRKVFRWLPPSGSWKRLPDLPQNFGEIDVSLAVGNKGYVVCKNSDTMSVSKLQTWEFDPSADSWTQKADAPFPPPTSLDPYAILPQTAGTDKFFVYRDGTIWSFTPATNQWSVFSKEPLIMSGSDALLDWVNGELYFGLSGPLPIGNYFWKYSP